jgi:hypothetical protein
MNHYSSDVFGVFFWRRHVSDPKSSSPFYLTICDFFFLQTWMLHFYLTRTYQSPLLASRPDMGETFPWLQGGGSMGVLMPIYTVAIIVFFVYTTMKVWGHSSSCSVSGTKACPALTIIYFYWTWFIFPSLSTRQKLIEIVGLIYGNFTLIYSI